MSSRSRNRFFCSYVITDGDKFKLKDHDPGDTRWVKSKKEGKELLPLDESFDVSCHQTSPF
jgi:hypothetical protein